jgi:2,4-diketo-3-deoxy-L-fuconate hydrolase
MATRLVRFTKNAEETPEWGELDSSTNTIKIIKNAPERLGDLLEKGWKTNTKDVISLDKVMLVSPITKPCQMLCQGLNYSDHVHEGGMAAKEKTFNMIFAKASSTISNPSGVIQKPAHVQLLDYEIELGIVIGKKITEPKNITKADLPEYIAGFFLANDVSARDIQIPQGQWFKGKSYRSFCPAGPYLILPTKEEFAYMDHFQLELKVNGEVRQKALAKTMVNPPAETLTEISGLMDLYPGDVILTGTPAGVAMRAPSRIRQGINKLLYSEPKQRDLFIESQKERRQYLKDGDKIESTITCPEYPEMNLGKQELLIRF